MNFPRNALAAAFTLVVSLTAVAQGAPQGEIKGTATEHTAASRIGVIDNANVALPASATGGAVFFGKWRDLPAPTRLRVPVIVFLHGSSGLALKAIEEWQRWLADMGVASVAPDSFALPDRLTYTSPIAKAVYERIHALRASEIALAVAAVKRSGVELPTWRPLAVNSHTRDIVKVLEHELLGITSYL